MEKIITASLEENEKDIDNDSYSKVMGEDKYARACLFGLNVSSTDLKNTICSRVRSKRIIAKQNDRIGELERCVSQLMAIPNKDQSISSPISANLLNPRTMPGGGMSSTPIAEHHASMPICEPRPLKVLFK